MKAQNLTDRLFMSSGALAALLTAASLVADMDGHLLGLSELWSRAIILCLGAATLGTNGWLLFRAKTMLERSIAALLLVFCILLFLPALLN